MLHFQHRFDEQEKGQYLHNRGDIEQPLGENAFDVDWDFYPPNYSLNVSNEAAYKFVKYAEKNWAIIDQVNSASLFDRSALILHGNTQEHFID
jgi:hypothetical protein